MDLQPPATSFSESEADSAPTLTTPPRELRRPYNVQDVLRRDFIAPPATLHEASDYNPGTSPIDVERYISRQFHDLAEQLPLVHKGLTASKTRRLTLSKYQESRIRHYNQTIDAYIANRI